jgi:hypothetical protein
MVAGPWYLPERRVGSVDERFFVQPTVVSSGHFGGLKLGRFGCVADILPTAHFVRHPGLADLDARSCPATEL